MDVTQPLLRPGGSARTRLLVDDRVVVVDALNGTEPVARATPAYGEGPDNLGRRRETPHSLPFGAAAGVGVSEAGMSEAGASGVDELLGRRTEIEDIEDALEDGETVVLSAGPGYGKTTLLHHLADHLPRQSPSAYPHGVVLLSGRGRTVEDLLFELFRACYEVPGRRPGAMDLRRHLTVVRALVLIDDVSDPVRLGKALADYAPYSRAVLATEAEPVGRDAFAEIVAGFGAVVAVEEIEDEVEDDLEDDVEVEDEVQDDLEDDEIEDDVELEVEDEDDLEDDREDDEEDDAHGELTGAAQDVDADSEDESASESNSEKTSKSAEGSSADHD